MLLLSNRLLVGIILLVTLVACGPTVASPSPTGLPETPTVGIPTPTATAAAPDPTIEPPSATVSETETGTPTWVPTASQTWPPAPTATRTPTATQRPTPRASRTQAPPATFTAVPANCIPNGQDQFVHDPKRLWVLAACVRVTGTVVSLRASGPDGDLHISLRLDAAYTQLLNGANISNQNGNLVVEPVCVNPPIDKDVARLCASDPAPFQGPWPAVRQHIWMEGRYVLDLGHSGWAELHPLYRWGVEP